MTKDIKKKSLHELSQEFPEKTYRELEKYRDADRQEEAQRIFTQQENEELKEEQQGVCITAAMRKDRGYPDLTDVLAIENNKLKTELSETKVVLKGTKRIVKEYHRDLVALKKRVQEAETETILVKGIGMNSPEMKSLKSEVEALKQQLHTDRTEYQTHLEEAKRTIKNLETRLAESLEVNESHQKLNGKLQERLTDVEEENKKFHDHLDKQIDGARQSGL